MKKFLALAALVLGLASCQNDFEGERVNGSAEVDFQLSVGAPELATRAGADGVTPDGQADLNSAYGAIDYFQGGTAGDDLRRDWSDVNLRYSLEVYDVTEDADGNKVVTNLVPVKDRQVKIVDKYEPVVFDLRLVPGREYRFVVFADFVPQNVTDTTQSTAIVLQQNLGISHTIGETLADIKLNNHGLNDERTDAYFATKDITITNSAVQDIVLKRPYGKVRVIATDLHELNLNVNPKAVKVEYTAPHLTNFNAVTGKATLDTANTKVVFDSKYNEIYKEVDKGGLANHFYTAGYDALEDHKHTSADGKVRHTHMTIFTDYILASDEGQTPYHFTMKVYDDAAMTSLIKETAFTTDIPVQRNYLTTVIGNVLTTASEIEVRIDDNFAGENVENMVFVNTAKEFQEALDNYVNGQTILFGGNIQGDVTIDQIVDNSRHYLIDGNGYKYDGTMRINGHSNYTGTDSVTIQNINFETNRSGVYFIEQNSTESDLRYAHNITIKDCSFNGAADQTTVAMRFRQCYNIYVENCVADGTTRANASNLHSFAQLYGCTNVNFEGVNINAHNGISFGTSIGNKIVDSEIVAEGYGIRVDASVATTLFAEDVDITAKLPIIARRTSNAYRFNLQGCDLEALGYQIVFTKGEDDAAFVAPDAECGYGVDCQDKKYTIFPGDKMYAYCAESLQYFLDNAAKGDNLIEFVDDIEGDVVATQKEGVNITVDGCEYKYDGTFTINGDARSKGAETLTLTNINFEATEGKTFVYAPTKYNDKYNYSHNVTIDGCTFYSATYNEGIASISLNTTYNPVLKNSTATNIHSLLQVQSCDNNVVVENVKVTDCKNGLSLGNVKSATIKGAEVKAKGYGVRLDGTTARTVEVSIEGGKIEAYIPVSVRKMNDDGCNATVTLDGTEVVKGGAYDVAICSNEYEEGVDPVEPKGTYEVLSTGITYTVFPAGGLTLKSVAKVGSTEYTTIDEAIANWANNSTLTLLDNVTLSDVITIKSTEHHILDLGTYTMTAASKKDAIQVENNGRSSASYALDIKADATNPGGIVASGKAVVRTSGKSGVKDRPIIRFYGGVFNGSYIVYHSGSNGTNCPQFYFYGGDFTGTIYANRALFQFYGGTFHGSLMISVDSSAYALIAGGRFNQLKNLYMSALNKDKFTIGSAKGAFDKGVYIDDEGYAVVGGPVITEFGDKFKAKVTNPTTWGNYLEYSSAAANGLYFTNAEVAKNITNANVVLP